MKIRPSVAINREGKILLMKYIYGGVEVYNLPGGNAEELESIAETVKRELVEEMNLEIEVGDMILVGETHQELNNNSVLHIVFNASIKNGDPKLNPEHTSALEVVWMDIDKLCTLNMYPNVGSILYKPRIHQYIGTINQNWF